MPSNGGRCSWGASSRADGSPACPSHRPCRPAVRMRSKADQWQIKSRSKRALWRVCGYSGFLPPMQNHSVRCGYLPNGAHYWNTNSQRRLPALQRVYNSGSKADHHAHSGRFRGPLADFRREISLTRVGRSVRVYLAHEACFWITAKEGRWHHGQSCRTRKLWQAIGRVQ